MSTICPALEKPMLAENDCPRTRVFAETARDFDVVVVGAGPAGICAAIAAARGGARTALVTDRPILGGSASSEIRVTPAGADTSPWNRFARETGIMEEMSLMLAEKIRVSGIWRWLHYDEIYFTLTAAEPNLTVYLNTVIDRAERPDNGPIRSVGGIQLRAERRLTFNGKLFIDCSGDGTLGYLAGADYRVGREAKDEYGEQFAPQSSDCGTMGATLLFSTADRGHAVPFTPPPWALDISNLPTLKEPGKNLQREFYRLPTGTFYGLWWAEYGGAIDSIHDDGDVVWHTRRLIYGLWDHIKNSGRFPDVERLEIDWIGVLPGKRESRRLLAPVIPTANDFLAQREYDDRIGFAGWAVDIHPPRGYMDPQPACTHEYLPGITDIPFACLYSRNVPNLLFAGRDISVSHEGLGVLRVIATTAVMGQAVGTAAALACRRAVPIADIATAGIAGLQRELVANDQSIIGYRLMQPDDLSRICRVEASGTGPAGAADPDQWLPLNRPTGLALPVNASTLETISFMAKPTHGAQTLDLQIFRADKPHNYRFHEKVGHCRVDVAEAGWFTFGVDAGSGAGHKLFFILDANPHLQIGGVCGEPMPGIFGFEITDKAPHHEAVATTEIGWKTSFNVRPFIPVFRTVPDLRLGAPENAIDGFVRPHGLPHCWTSPPVDAASPAWLRLELPEPATINRLELVFNSGLNIRRHDQPGIYPRLVKDYDIIAETAAAEHTLIRIRGNVQRFRRHDIAPREVKAIRLLIAQTWGAPCADLFDLRIYRNCAST